MRGISEAALIREAIDRYFRGNSHSTPPNPKAWDEAYQFLLKLQAQGPTNQQSHDWKRENAYEERLSRYDRKSKLG